MPRPAADRFIRKIAHAVAQHQLIGRNESVLVAVSGGPDSMALLFGMTALAPANSWQLGIAHLNHKLRQTASDDDALFVGRTAAALGLPYYHETIDVAEYQREHGLSLEEAAREVRYRFLVETAAARGFSSIAVGHHMDDNGELVIMNLLRGSGPLGLSGMPPKRSIPLPVASGGSIRLIRPLLGVRKAEIETYLKNNNISWVTDHTNSESHYLRNRIRHELLPVLRNRYNPNIIHTLNRIAEIFRSEEEWADSMTAPVFQSAVLFQSETGIALSLSRISEMHPAVRRRIVRTAIGKVKGNLRRVRLVHIDAAVDLCVREAASGQLDLPDRIRVAKEADRLLLTRESTPLRNCPARRNPLPLQDFEAILVNPGSIHIPEAGMTVQAEILPVDACPEYRNAGHRTAFIDMDAVSFPLTVRNAVPEDRFTPHGMVGSQQLKKYFTDHKIPVSRRMSCPVLVSSGKLIWLMGHRIDDSVKITQSTREVLKVQFMLA